MTLVPGWLHGGYMRLFTPVGRWLADRRVDPDLLTVCGTLLWVFGGVLYGAGHIHAGGWLLGVTAFFDVIDGFVARETGRTSTFGAFLDSTLDRISDAAPLCGLAFFFATSSEHASPAMVVLCLCGIVGSQLVSYTRARAEALGVECKVGLLQRPERVILLSAPMAFFGLLFDGLILTITLVTITLISWLTVFQRIAEVRRNASQ